MTKKLIEVALPLDEINTQSAREKSIRQGHPSTLHLWWARRPLAAARALIFAQMVNDPGGERGYYAGKTKAKANQEREILFDIIRDLVKWENTDNEEVLERARKAIKDSWEESQLLNKGKKGYSSSSIPAFHDPFAGGGSIPLEAQRLGLETHASDLNPVAVTINKAMLEIPYRFSKLSPIGPIPSDEKQKKLMDDWSGAKNVAEDIRRYGKVAYEIAKEKIGQYYPDILIDKNTLLDRPDLKKYEGRKLPVVAYLWTRTVNSPNPAYSNIKVPLARSFFVSKKKGREAWIDIVRSNSNYQFKVRKGKPDSDVILGTVKRTGGTCIMSNTAMPFKYIRNEGKSGRMGKRLMAIIVEGDREKVFLSPSQSIEDIATSVPTTEKPSHKLPFNPRDFKTPNYGMMTFGDLFSARQLLALNTFSETIIDLRKMVKTDAVNFGLKDDGISFENGGNGADAYADAISIYLTFAVGRSSNYWSTLTPWGGDFIVQTFGRQALPMVWDYAEANPFSSSTGNWLGAIEWIAKAISQSLSGFSPAFTYQEDAQTQNISANKVISTDPPYYDNICYADLSDYFYTWFRRSLRKLLPELYSTMAVPKAEELVATPYRHDNNKSIAESFFLNGMTHAMKNMADQSHPEYPVTIYYAFKQTETKDSNTGNTGWETFLEAVLEAGFSITGTWPIRAERDQGLKSGKNFLASCVVLVCRKRINNSSSISRRDFQRELREQMPDALEVMIGGESGQTPIAPVDLAQAAIGPGIAIFSKYSQVLNQDGSKMGVHEALVLINRAITDYLNPESGNFDEDTLFCNDWFDQYGWSSGLFGEADTLARAKGTSVDGVRDAGVIHSGSGKVRLLKWNEYLSDWDPINDNRTPVWEALHQMIRVLNQNGETDAGSLLARMPERGESIRQLAYHLYTLCERKGWAEEARAYNELISAWHAIVAASHDSGHVGSQTELEI